MRSLAVPGLAIVLLLNAACNDTTFTIDPLLATDTVEIAAPLPGNAALPTALDITVRGGLIGGARFPERATDAGEWDFGLRVRDGELVLVPAAALGLSSRAAITRALANQTFDGLNEAPGRTSFVTDSAVVLREGSVYAARSRLPPLTSCEQYAKLQPLSVDRTLGRIRLLITANERCSDPRLALED